MKSNLIDIAVMRHAETTKAVLVSDDGDRERAVWLPKQHIEMEPLPGTRDGQVVVTMPEWLAVEKGFV